MPKAFPAYSTSAAISGLILLASGMMLAVHRARPWGALLAAGFLGLWVVGLHLPHAIEKPTVVVNWNAVCESLAMTTGAVVGLARR